MKLTEKDKTILETLKQMGLEEDTIVLFTADHGDMLGERGLWFKMTWFENASRVPLIVHAPGSLTARRVSHATSHVDLLPTLVELAGDGRPFEPAVPIDGRSLLSHLAGTGGHDRVLGEYCGEGAVAPLVMIREGKWKFVHSPADPDQLYDLESDPDERRNLADDQAHRVVCKGYRSETDRLWDLEWLTQQVLASQRRRNLVQRALSKGRHTSWDHQPMRDASTSYMRNHLVLDDLESRTRWPRVGI